MTTLSKPAGTAHEMIAAKRRRPWQGEEEVRIAWVAALEAELGIHFDAERARKDSSYNTVIIEFKAPGLFKGSKQTGTLAFTLPAGACTAKPLSTVTFKVLPTSKITIK